MTEDLKMAEQKTEFLEMGTSENTNIEQEVLQDATVTTRQDFDPIPLNTIEHNNQSEHVVQAKCKTVKTGRISLVSYDDTSGESTSEEDVDMDNNRTSSGLIYRHKSISESSDSSISNDSDESECKLTKKVKDIVRVPKVKGELSIDDLPPIEDLTISVQRHETLLLGKIQSIVDQLVVVQSNPGTTAVDLDSILFLEEGTRALGKVFDVIGPVKEPLYCVRFNSKEHIKNKQISVGAPVYYAPKTEHTSYIFIPDLLRIKGSDASWENDIEPPEKYLDFSDDEVERTVRKSKKKVDNSSTTPVEYLDNPVANLIHGQQNAGTQSNSMQSPKNISNREQKRAMYRKNYNFPFNPSHPTVHSGPPPHSQLFNPLFANQIPPAPSHNRVTHPMHQQFPNVGQTRPPFPTNHNQQPSSNYNIVPCPTYPWNGHNIHPHPPINRHVDTSQPPPPLFSHPPPLNPQWAPRNTNPGPP